MITDEVKNKLRTLDKQGYELKALAQRFGIARGTVSKIVNFKPPYDKDKT